MLTNGKWRADQRPLYIQASGALRDLLRSDGSVAGDKLPSEVILSQRLGISRPTLREALRLLEDEGAIVRKHGVGTFVAFPSPIIEDGLEVLESIDCMAKRRGVRTGMCELCVEERVTTPNEMKELGLQTETDVVEVRRVITEGMDQRVALLVDVVPQDVLRSADLGSEFRGSVLDLFLTRGWPDLLYSRTELIPAAADSELAIMLRIRRGSPLQKLEARLYEREGRIVDYSISHYVPGYFRFHVIRRVGSQSGGTVRISQSFKVAEVLNGKVRQE